MKPIPLVRFDALASYARRPMARIAAEEMSWFEHADERVLGLVLRDRTDNDFAGNVFGRDRKGRFRSISLTDFFPTQRRAEVKLRQAMEQFGALPDEEYFQGDEEGEPVDFFAAVSDNEKLNPAFEELRDNKLFSAARGIIEPMMKWYSDSDGNFVEQFQTTGFDPRIWELYLFAAFSEMGYDISRIHAIPDFVCEAPFSEFSVEAVTVNPSRDKANNIVLPPPTDTPEELIAFIQEYMPIRFAGSLKAKLEKKYWEKSHVTGKPLLFAIQDFSATGSMVHTRSAFERYVTGYQYDFQKDLSGNLFITPRAIESHVWGTKIVPSGFFRQPGSENISAILFSNSGTISKFNRMGLLAGFGSPRLKLTRFGTRVDHDQNSTMPKRFRVDVSDPSYFETWCEGIDIWHNPNALYPLDPRQMPGVAHHRLEKDGRLISFTPAWHPLGSWTFQHLEVE